MKNRSIICRFQQCRPNFDARYCEICHKLLRYPECKCPICHVDYSECVPIWSIYFTIDKNEYQAYVNQFDMTEYQNNKNPNNEDPNNQNPNNEDLNNQNPNNEDPNNQNQNDEDLNNQNQDQNEEEEEKYTIDDYKIGQDIDQINLDKSQIGEINLNVNASGSVLDPVIGFTIKDFFYLIDKIPNIDWRGYLTKYFVNTYFIITLDTYEKIKQICLKRGSNLTFRVWITMHSDIKIDKETITSMLLERYLDDDDDEEAPFGMKE